MVCPTENEQRKLEQQREDVELDFKIVARPKWCFG